MFIISVFILLLLIFYPFIFLSLLSFYQLSIVALFTGFLNFYLGRIFAIRATIYGQRFSGELCYTSGIRIFDEEGVGIVFEVGKF